MRFQNWYCLRYWSRHKAKAFSLILSVLLVTSAVLLMMLNERTEQRRNLHRLYNLYGDCDFVARNIPSDQVDSLAKAEGVSKIGAMVSVGKMAVGDLRYTVGAFCDRNAEKMMHLPLDAGRFPVKSGEIAMPSFLLTGQNAGAQIGDSVRIEVEDLSNNLIDKTYQLVGIISQKTNRRDMDYGYTEVNGVTQNPPMDAPSPCIYLTEEDAAAFSQSYFNMCITFPEQWYTLPEDASERELKQELGKHIEEIGGIVTNGGAHAFIMTSQSGQNSASEALTFSETTNTFVMRRLFFVMAAVAAISLVSGIISIMPDRIRSLRLLKCIGVRNSTLTGIFISESLMFWSIGTLLGTAVGCGIHEGLLTVQKALGQAFYRGYTAEWLVQQKTLPPFRTAMLLSAGITAAAMIIPILRVCKMKAIETDGQKHSHQRPQRTSRAVFSKLLSDRGVSALQCLSLLMVLCASMFAFLYYSGNGKGANYPYLEYRTDTDAEFFVKSGIDMKAAQIDITLTGHQPAHLDWGNSGTVCGITPKTETALRDLGDVYAWGPYAGSCTVFYENPEDAPPLLEAFRAPFNEKWIYYEQYKDTAFYMIPILLLNDRMLAEIGAEPDAKVIWASKDGAPPYEVGDTVPLTTAVFDQAANHVDLKSTRIIPVAVNQSIRITNALLQSSIYLNAIRGMFGSQTIIMSAEYAAEIGMNAPTYTCAYVSLSDTLSETEIRASLSPHLDTTVSYVTLQSLERSLKQKKLLEYASVFLLFSMFFTVSMLGVFHILRMQITRNLPNLRRLHQIGMSVRSIRNLLTRRALLLPMFAMILTAGILFGFQKIEQMQFQKYSALITEQQHLLGETDFPNVDAYYIPRLSDLEQDDPVYAVTAQAEEIRTHWMLSEELWEPKPWGFLMLLSGLVFGMMTLAAFGSMRHLNQEIREEILL